MRMRLQRAHPFHQCWFWSTQTSDKRCPVCVLAPCRSQPAGLTTVISTTCELLITQTLQPLVMCYIVYPPKAVQMYWCHMTSCDCWLPSPWQSSSAALQWLTAWLVEPALSQSEVQENTVYQFHMTFEEVYHCVILHQRSQHILTPTKPLWHCRETQLTHSTTFW